MKEMISMCYSSYKPWGWMRLDLKFTRDIYINSNLDPLTKFSTSSRSTKFKEHFSNDHKDHPSQHKKGVSPFKFEGKSKETETTTLSEFPNRGKATVEQILVSEERNPKEQDCENLSRNTSCAKGSPSFT